MNIELAIAIGIIIGLCIGLVIDRNARRERDERINKLEKELKTKQNVCESNNGTINRLRRENEQLKKKFSKRPRA